MAEIGSIEAVRKNNETTERKLRTSSGDYNEATRIKQLIHEEYNSARNYHAIIQAFEEGRARDLGHERKVARTPCLIIGSGPSLDEAMPRMHEWKGGIICSPSHARTLMRWGVEPTHILCLDPFNNWGEIEGPDWSKTRTKMIVNPGVWPDLIANWPNEILMYRQNLGRSGHFYQNEQKRMYTKRVAVDEASRNYEFQYLITSEITLFACSPPCQAFAANALGYGNVFMLGVDFAYHEDKERFTDYTLEDGEWVEHVYPPGSYEIDGKDKSVTTNNGLKSQITHMYYLKNMITALRLSWQNAIWVGLGAVTSYPTTTVDEMYDSQGKGYKRLTHAEIRKITDTYLAEVGAYVIEAGPHKMSFIESVDPEIEARAYMVKLKRKYICPNCGGMADAPDDTDYTGMQCRNCGKPNALVNMSKELNIEANMRRIRKLIAAVAVQEKPDHPMVMPSVADVPGLTSL